MVRGADDKNIYRWKPLGVGNPNRRVLDAGRDVVVVMPLSATASLNGRRLQMLEAIAVLLVPIAIEGAIAPAR